MISMWDLFSREDLKDALKEGLINVRYSSWGWRILNYSSRAPYTNGAWDNPAVTTCRGLIVDENDMVQARPWKKFHNVGQKEADHIDLDEPVEVTDKADGSVGILYCDPTGTIRVASRGSFESEQAKWATKWISDTIDIGMWVEGFTPLVEIVYPENRVVLNYNGYKGLILLGGVWNDSGNYVGPEQAERLIDWSGDTTEVLPYTTLREALEAPPRENAEGLVVRARNPDRLLKIKQADYVERHRMIFGMSEKYIWEWRLDNPYPAPIDSLLDGLPDELHGWVRETDKSLFESVRTIDARVDAEFRKYASGLTPWSVFTRKDAASVFLSPETKDIAPLLFLRLDNRDTVPAILKTLKPRGDSRPVFYHQENE